MKNAPKWSLCVISTALLSITGAGAAAQVRTDTPPVRVFDAGELTPSHYTVVKRLWTDTWRASFWISRHVDAGAAVTALTTQAASLGADGVVNLHCLNDAGGWGGGYRCYGLAIRLK